MSSACSWTSRFNRPLFLWWAVAFAIQLGVDCSLKYGNLRPPFSSLIVFLPALAWIFVIVSFVRAILTLDEFQLRFHLQAASIACVLCAAVALIFSALERAGVYRVTWSAAGGWFLLLLLSAYGFLAWKFR